MAGVKEMPITSRPKSSVTENVVNVSQFIRHKKIDKWINILLINEYDRMSVFPKVGM